jgi:hypothetical protein
LLRWQADPPDIVLVRTPERYGRHPHYLNELRCVYLLKWLAKEKFELRNARGFLFFARPGLSLPVSVPGGESPGQILFDDRIHLGWAPRNWGRARLIKDIFSSSSRMDLTARRRAGQMTTEFFIDPPAPGWIWDLALLKLSHPLDGSIGVSFGAHGVPCGRGENILFLSKGKGPFLLPLGASLSYLTQPFVSSVCVTGNGNALHIKNLTLLSASQPFVKTAGR